MYLSNSKRFLFIAIPKTGCSSILYALSSDKMFNNKSSTHVWNFKYPEIYHSTLENTLDNIDKVEHLGFNVLDESFFNYDNFEDDYVKFENKIQSEIVKKSYYKAVFVRNPWDRFISGYLDLQKHVPGRFSKRYNIWATQEETPNWYKEWDFKNFEDFCMRFKSSGWSEDRHFKPQLDFMTIDNNISVNFIGKFENLQNDFNNLLSKLGSENIQLPHIHKSDRSRYRTYNSEKSKTLVEEFYKKVIQEFDYEF